MQYGQTSKQIHKLIIRGIVEGLAAFTALLLIPSDQKDALMFGYSFERLVLLALVLFIAAFLFISSFHKKSYEGTVIGRLLSARWVFVISVFIPIIILGFVLLFMDNEALLLRLCPVFLYACVLSVEIIHFQRKNTAYHASIFIDITNWLSRKNVLFAIVITASAGLLFANAFTHPEPLSFAGLYTLMAEEISEANFRLPLQVDLYIPGGMPFAYPPLGLYIMAAFLKAGGSVWVYLRFAPPLFSLLGMIVFFLLVRRMTRSDLGGACATLLAAGSLPLFYMQAESGGIIRGLAFFLGLLSIYFLDRMMERFRWREALLAGLFFGLTGLTHLGYAYYFAFWVMAWVITHPQKKNWLGAGGMVITSLLVALPWLTLTIQRYGFSVIASAFQSHSTTSFLTYFHTPANIITTIWSNLQGLIDQPWLLGLVLCGLICLLLRKKFTLPVLFSLLVLLNFQGSRFVLIVGFMIIGCGISYLYDLIPSIRNEKNRSWTRQAAIIGLTALLILNYGISFGSLLNEQPLINQDMIDACAFMENNTPAQTTFLPLFSQDDQSEEWLPYLSQRTIAYPRWGSEWLGNIDEQAAGEEGLWICMRQQSLTCLDDWFGETDTHADYLILTNDLETLSGALQQSGEWSGVYSNERYEVWERVD